MMKGFGGGIVMSGKWVFRSFISMVITFLVIAIGIGSSFAATTGKVSGLVVDAGTGETIPGVSVVIEGTRLGAVTDVEGEYFIISVPSGEYTVRAIMMGYRTVEKTGVQVVIDRTSRVDFELEATITELAPITVEAERELVPMDVSSSQTVVSADEIGVLPINSFEGIISMIPGVSGASVRGGAIDETLLLLNDFSIEYFSSSFNT